MTDCKLEIVNCKNLVLRTSVTGRFKGQNFLGCKNYPACSYIIPLQFDETNMSDEQKELERAFSNFIFYNSFIYATYGVVYFNLREASFLDYLLRNIELRRTNDIEIGLTGAKIFPLLFYHIFLIPEIQIKRYLINNFPGTYLRIEQGCFVEFFSEGIDYKNQLVDEKVFERYININTYNR